MMTAGNKQKSRAKLTLPFPSSNKNMDSFFEDYHALTLFLINI